MANGLGRIRATAAPAAEADPKAPKADASLPDPSTYARGWLLGMLVAALALAVVLNKLELTADEFKPAQAGAANFALFAGFYVAAQVIERLMELVTPLLPWWDVPTDVTDPAAKAAQIKADRSKAALGVATLAGVGASCGLGLFFLRAVGMDVSHTVDAFFTGLVIAAGTKPLHDFTSLLQNKNSPTTGTAGV